MWNVVKSKVKACADFMLWLVSTRFYFVYGIVDALFSLFELMVYSIMILLFPSSIGFFWVVFCYVGFACAVIQCSSWNLWLDASGGGMPRFFSMDRWTRWHLNKIFFYISYGALAMNAFSALSVDAMPAAVFWSWAGFHFVFLCSRCFLLFIIYAKKESIEARLAADAEASRESGPMDTSLYVDILNE